MLVLVSASTVGQAGQLVNGMSLALAGVFAAYFMSMRQTIVYLIIVLSGYVAAVTYSSSRKETFLYTVSVVVIVTGVTMTVANLTNRLKEQTLRDPLTKAYNRRGLFEVAAVIRPVALRAHSPITIVMADLDKFKQYNDTNGHAGGDALLKDLTDAWSKKLRDSDVFARLGGDEFVFLLPNTDLVQVEGFISRLKQSYQVAFSTGISMWTEDITLDEALERADAELYRMKRNKYPTR